MFLIGVANILKFIETSFRGESFAKFTLDNAKET